MSLKNGPYLFRETCTSISLKHAQLPWQTDPYPCSSLGWPTFLPHFTPLCKRSEMVGLPEHSELLLPWQLQRSCCFISCVMFAVINLEAGQHFWGDLPWGYTSLPNSTCHYSTRTKTPSQGLVNRHALPFKCITGIAVLPPLI